MTSRRWLLLHGTPLTPAVWAPTAAELGDQAALIPDCSSVPPDDEPQRTIAQRLLHETEGDFDVVGHSFGGQTALELALLAPERVRTLTVLCSRDTPVPAFTALAASVRAGNGPTAESTLARWFSASELEEESAAVRSARTILASASNENWARALDAIAGYDASERTPALPMPVVLIAAGHDGVSDPQAMSALARRIPHAMLSVEPEWFHMSPFVLPGALAARLRAGRASGS